MLTTLTLLPSIIIGVLMLINTNSDDSAVVIENEATQQVNETMDNETLRTIVFGKMRTAMTAITQVLLAMLVGLTSATRPNAIMNTWAKQLKSAYQSFVGSTKVLSGKIKSTHYGLRLKDDDGIIQKHNWLRDAAKAGVQWAVLTVDHYIEQVVCDICDKVADKREICSSTVSGIMGAIESVQKWSDEIGDMGGYLTESVAGVVHKGTTALEYTMRVTDKETWEAVVFWLSNGLGRPQNTVHEYLPNGRTWGRDSNPNYVDYGAKLRFAKTVVAGFERVENQTEQATCTL